MNKFLLPYTNQDLFTKKNQQTIKSNERLLFPLHPCTKKIIQSVENMKSVFSY